MECCPDFSRCLAVLLLAGAVVVTTVSCTNGTSNKSSSSPPSAKATGATNESKEMPKDPAPDIRENK